MVRWSRAVVLALCISAFWLSLLPAATAVRSADVAAARSLSDYVVLDSDPGHWVVDGERREWRGDEITVQPTATGVGIIMTRGSETDSQDDFSILILPPPGDELAVGDYRFVRHPAFVPPGDKYAGLDLGGDGHGCNTEFGRLRILDIAPDFSRLWIVFDHRCSTLVDADEAWGEIKIGVTDRPEQAVVLPGVMDFGEEYPGVTAEPPGSVRWFNTSSAPQSASPAVTAGNHDFSLAGNTCGLVAPRDSCEALIGFRPQAAGNRNGASTFSTSSGSYTTPLVGRGIPGHNGWEVRAAPGAVPGGRTQWSINPVNGTVGLAALHGVLSFFAVGDGGGFALQLKGVALFRTGTYEDDGDGRGPDLSLNVDDGHGLCNGVGTITISQSAPAPNGYDPETLAGTFKHYCNGWVTGSFAYRAAQLPAPPPLPTSPPPPPQDSGELTLKTDQPSYRAGDLATVTATWSKGTDEEITILAAVGNGPEQPLVTRQVDASGRVVVTGRLTRNTRFIAVSDDLRVEAAVDVAPVIETRTVGAVRRNGAYTVLRGAGTVAATLRPAHAGDCLAAVVERRRGGAWERTSVRPCIRLSEAGRAAVRVKGKRGDLGRVRFGWAGDAANAAAATPWTNLKFLGKRR